MQEDMDAQDLRYTRRAQQQKQHEVAKAHAAVRRKLLSPRGNSHLLIGRRNSRTGVLLIAEQSSRSEMISD